MTERLAEIGARIGGIRQLGAVVNAMRGIAAARAQQARGQLAAVDSYSDTIAGAIGQVLALLPTQDGARAREVRRPALVLFCAEQGFAGAFSERVLDVVGPGLADAELFLVGTRGLAVASERGIVPGAWLAMPSHSPGIPGLADRLCEAIFARIATGRIDQLDAVFTRAAPGAAGEIVRRRLFPFDLAAFPPPARPVLPMIQLDAAVLLGELTADYMHGQLCTASLHAFSAENEARMAAMAAAHSQIDRRLTALQATQRRVRQEEITAEVIELAAGETASRRR